MAVSAFGDPLDDEPQAAVPKAPAVSAFGDALDDEPGQPEQGVLARAMSWLGNINREASDTARRLQAEDEARYGKPADRYPGAGSVLGPTLADPGVSLLKGATSLGQAATGIANIASGGAAGNYLEQHGIDLQAAQEALDRQYTADQQAANRAVDDATGFGGKIGAYASNPSAALQDIIESAPGMLAGGVIGRGVAGALPRVLPKIAGVAPVIGGAAGEGVIAAGQAAEEVRRETGGLTAGQALGAVGTGAATGVIGLLGGVLGKRLGIGDLDTQLAGGNGADVARGIVTRVLGGGSVEAIEEMSQGAQEQIAKNAMTGRPLFEGVPEAAGAGAVLGGAMGAGAGARRPNVAPGITQGQSAGDASVQYASTLPASPTQDPGQLSSQAQSAPIPGPLAPRVPTVEQATPFAGSSDINPLLDRLGVQGDQRAKTLDLLAPVEFNVEDTRRGALSLQEQHRLAEMIGLKGAKQLTFERKIGQAWNAEETMAVTSHVRSQLTDVLTRQSGILDGTASDIDRAQFVASVQAMRQGFTELMGARAEAGRALAAYKRDVQNIRQAQDILEQVGGAAGADAMARAINQAMKSGGVPAVSKAVGHEGWGNKLLGRYWRAALLTSPSTHVTNVAGNIGMLATEVLERSVAAGIGAAKRKLTGGKSGQTVFEEPLQLVIGAARGQLNAYRAANTAWETGESAILGGGIKEPGQALSLKPETMGGKVDYALTLPYRMLAVQDAYMAQLNFEGELRALAYQQAQSEKRSGQLQGKVAQRVEELLANPPADLVEASTSHARVQTFNQAGGPLVNAINGAKRKFPLLELVAPFIRTPTNLAKAAIKRTPLAAFAPSVHEDIKAGGARQERALARIAVGTSFMIFAGALATAGRITGAGPDDPEEKRALLNSGWQPYSFRTEGGQYVQYNRADPFSSLLSLAADLATTKWKDSNASDLVARVIGSFAESFVNKTYMSGVSDLLEMLAEPKRKAGTWLDRTGAGLLQPFSIISRAAQADDPYARESDSFTDSLKYRFPGLRRELNQKLDAFGFPVANPGYMGEGWPSWAAGVSSPTRITEETEDPVRLEAQRLSWSPGAPTGYITHKGEKHELTPEQHHEFRALAGHMIYVGTARLMRSKEYRALTDNGKLDALQKLEQKARSAVRMAMLPAVVGGNRGALERLQQRTDAALEQIRGAQ